MKKKSPQKNGFRKLPNGTYELMVDLGRDPSTDERRRRAVYAKTQAEAKAKRAELLKSLSASSTVT